MTKGIFHNKSDQVHPVCYQANELDTKSIYCKLSTKGKEVTPGGEDVQSARAEGWGVRNGRYSREQATDIKSQPKIPFNRFSWKAGNLSLQVLCRNKGRFRFRKTVLLFSWVTETHPCWYLRESKLRTWKALKATAHSGVRNSGAEAGARTLGAGQNPTSVSAGHWASYAFSAPSVIIWGSTGTTQKALLGWEP